MSSGMSSTAKRALRARLWARSQKCHWCGRQMTLPPWPTRTPPPNGCTIDHLDSRLSPARGSSPGARRRVLACYACNHARNETEQQALPLAEVHRRSGRPTP
jgi:hypothetical protein